MGSFRIELELKFALHSPKQAVGSSRLAITFRFKWGVINYGSKEGIFSQNKTLSLNVRSSISTAAKELSASNSPPLALSPRIVDTIAGSRQTRCTMGKTLAETGRINERVSGRIKDVTSSDVRQEIKVKVFLGSSKFHKSLHGKQLPCKETSLFFWL